MKLKHFFTFFIAPAVLGACGSSTPLPVSYPQASTAYNYSALAALGLAGSCGSSTGTMLNQIPLYVNNQFIGYKVTMALGARRFMNGYQTTFQTSVPVCAGDVLTVTGTGAYYGVAQAFCGGGVLTGFVSPRRLGGPISNLAVSLNGQAVGVGTPVTSTQSGTLIISGSYPPLYRDCGWPFSGQASLTYFVNLGPSITVQRCVAVTGAPMTCPY